MSQSILNKLGMVPFQPLPFISKGKTQTIAAFYFPYNPLIDNTQQHIISLPDNDKIVLVENRPKKWLPSQRVILLVHGLGGSHLSKYLIRLTRLLVQQGFLVIRMNLRGCGAGIGLARHLYHSGRSEDTRAVCNWLSQHFPHSPITQIGFSLGANITLKMAGEDANTQQNSLDSIIAVSPPLDLEASVKLIIKKQNQILDQHFVKGLLHDIYKMHQNFPDLLMPTFPDSLTLYDFDEIYTAPRSGFKNAKDYYTRCSSFQFVDKITLPTFILYAQDDPVVSRIKFSKISYKENIDLLITKKGGHVGWLGYTGKCCWYRWMDKVVVKWVKWLDKQNLSAK